MSAQLAERLRCEIDTMHVVGAHANVVRLVEVLDESDRLSLVLEYCAGGSLRELLAARGRLELSHVWHLTQHLASGLEHLYKYRVMHRDLKPENLLLSEQSPLAQLRLADFGFARNVDSSTQLHASILGTPFYMAPELLDGKPYDYAADLWSVGAIVFEMLVGAKPWPGATSFQTLRIAQDQPLQFPRRIVVSECVMAFIRRLLVVDPSSRVRPAEFFIDPFFDEYVRVPVAHTHLQQAPPLAPTDFIIMPNDNEETVGELLRECAAKFNLAANEVTLVAGPGTGAQGDVISLDAQQSLGSYKLLEHARPVYVFQTVKREDAVGSVLAASRSATLTAAPAPNAFSLYDPPSALGRGFDEQTVSSARSTFSGVAHGRSALSSDELSQLLEYLSIPLEFKTKFEKTSSGGVTFDSFLRGLIEIRDHACDELRHTFGDACDPIQLIGVGVDRKFIVKDDALAKLRAYDCPLKIIGILGAYRTGKSYLMNLLFDRPDGFKLGSTVKGETRGVWISVRRSTKSGAPAVALLDSEGLFDVDNPDADYDLRIMMVTMMLSSLLVINVKGQIDSSTFKMLAVVTRLSEKIKATANESADAAGQDFATLFPQLLIVVRDAMLEIKSNDSYLDSALSDVKGTSEAIVNANTVRSLLRTWFPKRSLWRLLQPRSNEGDLQHMEKFTLDQTRLEFAASMAPLKAHVIRNAPEKLTGGTKLTGVSLASYVRLLVPAINDGVSFVVADAWHAMNVEQCTTAIDEAVQLYAGNMDADCASLPLELDNLLELNSRNWDAAVAVYDEQAPASAAKQQMLTDLHSRLDVALQALVARNERASADLCERIAKEIETAASSVVDKFDAFQRAFTDGLARFDDEAFGPAVPVIKEKLLERLKLLQQTAKLQARLDDAQKKALELESQLQEQKMAQQKLQEALEAERATREEQLRKHDAVIKELEKASRDEIEAIKREGDEKLARYNEDLKRAIADGNMQARKWAEADIQRVHEEVSTSLKKQNEMAQQLMAQQQVQRDTEQQRLEQLRTQLQASASSSSHSAVRSQKHPKKKSHAAQCTGTNTRGERCGNKRNDLVGGRCEYHQ
jgi:serine/threonine protein kinase